MKLKNLEEALHKTPFAPFDIHLDGKTIRVEHPDQVLFAFERTTIVVAPNDSQLHIIEVDQIKFLTLHRRSRGSKAA